MWDFITKIDKKHHFQVQFSGAIFRYTKKITFKYSTFIDTFKKMTIV